MVFSGIGNIHAVNDAFEELRNALDPLRISEKKDESFMVDMMVSSLEESTNNAVLQLPSETAREIEERGDTASTVCLGLQRIWLTRRSTQLLLLLSAFKWLAIFGVGVDIAGARCTDVGVCDRDNETVVMLDKVA